MLLLVIFTGCAGSYSWQALPDSSENERTIFVVSLGWHTGLILPSESLSALPDLEKVMGELKKQHSDEIDFAKAGTLLKQLLNK